MELVATAALYATGAKIIQRVDDGLDDDGDDGDDNYDNDDDDVVDDDDDIGG